MTECDPKPDIDPRLDAYQSVTASVAAGLLRLASARIAVNSFSIDLLRAVNERTTAGAEASVTASAASRLSPCEFDSFSYISNVSHLVYAATLLDSFLADTTTFLFLLFPGALGKDTVAKLDEVLQAPTREALIGDIVRRRVRDVGYMSFLDRIAYLAERFSLGVALDENDRLTLEEFSTLRNVIVHDQSVFDLYLDEKGRVQAKQKACGRHPTPVPDVVLKKAHRAFFSTVRAIHEAVVSQVLKRKGESEFQSIMDALVDEAGVAIKQYEHGRGEEGNPPASALPRLPDEV
jgi:hypothetical protein